MKRQKNSVPDERQKLIFLKSAAITGGFLVLCVIASMIYKLIVTGDPGWEFWSLIGCSAVMLLSRRFLGDIEAPKDIMDRPLPTGSSKGERRIRKRDYALKSCIFALTWAVMDILLFAFGENELTDMELTEFLFPSLSKGATIAVTAVIAFVSMFVISYIFEYLICEKYKIKP